MRRALYVLFHYPSITEGYIESEIQAVSHAYEVLVVTKDHQPQGVTYYKNHSPHQEISSREHLMEVMRAFAPDIVHAHRLFMLPWIAPVCLGLGIPFTVRSHSLDTIPSTDPRVTDWMRKASVVLRTVTQNQLCRGVLAFPFVRKTLEKWGVPPDKIYDCYPVIDFARFHNPAPNGKVIVNAGSYMPKKRMEDFLELGSRMRHRTFKLYALSSRTRTIEELREKNRLMGNPVTIMDPVQPEDMPAEYKQAEWMVYTADHTLANVGWPVSIAEAQAAGVGVCMANIRPDVRGYVGEAGYVFDSLEEVEAIISQPFDEEKRQLGFEQAKKSDVFEHRKILLDLWRGV